MSETGRKHFADLLKKWGAERYWRVQVDLAVAMRCVAESDIERRRAGRPPDYRAERRWKETKYADSIADLYHKALGRYRNAVRVAARRAK